MQGREEYSQEQPPVICNRCGKQLSVREHVLQEERLHVEKCWGYFSGKDGKRHRWDMCEACYDRLIESFLIPVEETDMTELI